MERRMKGNFHVRCEAGENPEITSKDYLLLQNIYPSKITVLSTNKTMDIELGDKVLKHYPIVFADYPTDESSFIDSTRINNSYTASLGADYDGDTVSIRAVFTQEANAEADRLIKAKTMVLNQSGKNTRKIGNDGALAIYCLTK